MTVRHMPSFLTMVAIPLYVLGSFASHALAPYWPGNGTEALPEPTVISFVGDMMWDRYIREKADVHGYDTVLASVVPLFASSTHVVGNLEGPITTYTPVSDYRDSGPNHFRFTFATTVAEVLATAGFRGVTVANNHMLNFGTEGVVQTRQWLDRAAIASFGSVDDPYTPWRFAHGGRSFALYAFDSWHANDHERVISGIEGEHAGTIVMVFAHWGEEYDTVPNSAERTLAHAFVDAGADLVVGSHPHVVQSKELYEDVWIYYSLGNFVFDQYFSDEVRCGLVLSATFDTATTTLTESFIELARDGTTRPSTCMSDVPRIGA